MNIEALNGQMIILFVLIFVGYAAAKTRLLQPNANRFLADLVINISCPATTIYAVATSSRALSNQDVLFILGISVLIYVVLILFALPVAAMMGLKRSQSGVYRFMLIFGNVGFLGYPVVQALSGPDAVFIAAMFNLVFQLVVFTYGIMLIAEDPAQRKMSWRTFTTPMIIASLLALVLYLANVPFHHTVTEVLSYLDRITAPASMLVIGCTLAAFPLKKVFTDWRVYVMSFFKLIVIPVLTWLVLRFVISDPMILQVMVVLSALPAATNATLLCAKYDGDQVTAASGVFISTLLSVVTLPLLLKILFC